MSKELPTREEFEVASAQLEELLKAFTNGMDEAKTRGEGKYHMPGIEVVIKELVEGKLLNDVMKKDVTEAVRICEWAKMNVVLATLAYSAGDCDDDVMASVAELTKAATILIQFATTVAMSVKARQEVH